MTPSPSLIPRSPITASPAVMARGHETVSAVACYWQGYWFSAGVPAAES
ncbi:hypothetical protein [Halomonas getboli]|nr:hypothetical protein [Halomonas getboli]MCK2185296.1 hypothetical protein [Halomonas getboli]